MKSSFRKVLGELENEHWWYRGRRRILETALERLIGPASRTLTIGVGVAREAEMLAHRYRLVAIDKAEIDPHCAKLALAAQAEATELPFHEACFDAVFVFDVLEHIEGEVNTLNEVRRVLKPGGMLLMTVPAYMLLYGRQDIISEHKRRYRRSKLCRLLERQGFDVCYATYFNTLLFPFIGTYRITRRLLRLDGIGPRGDFDVRLPRPLERLLEELLSLERHVIDRSAFPFGVSILVSARLREQGGGATSASGLRSDANAALNRSRCSGARGRFDLHPEE